MFGRLLAIEQLKDWELHGVESGGMLPIQNRRDNCGKNTDVFRLYFWVKRQKQVELMSFKSPENHI